MNKPDHRKSPSTRARPHHSATHHYDFPFAQIPSPIAVLLSVFRFFGRPGLILLLTLGQGIYLLVNWGQHTLGQLSAEILRRQPRCHRNLKIINKLWFSALVWWKTLKLPTLEITLPRVFLPKIRIAWWQAGLFITVSVLGLGSSWFYQEVIVDLPSPEQLITRPQKLTTQIFDRNGVLLYKIYKAENRTLVPLEQIPLLTQQAFIAAEDKHFYYHHGVDLVGTARAVWRNLSQRQLQGGSTITQQLVKNALLSPRRSLERKLKEMVLALETELAYTKEDILQMYLNEVGFGGPVYGIQEAAQQYFGKNVSELSLAESALLAGLPKAPTKFSPFGSNLAKDRQLYVLERMVTDGYITLEQAKQAAAETLSFRSPSIAIKAPHFVQFVREFLVDQLGEEMVSEGGLQVYTTLDYNLQQQAEVAINQELDRIKSANVTNGAALITNPASGEILAMVGSRDYFDIKNDGQVNLTTALRQPGSAVKPINYSSAFEQGLTTASIIPDQPVSFKVGQTIYSPSNYDHRYHGPVTARTALANSYNVPAVVVLAKYGISQMANLGKQLGILSWNDPSRWGLSLTLGGMEVSMVELAGAYGTFANLGQHLPLTAVAGVYTSGGESVKISLCLDQASKKPCQPEQVLKPTTAYLINSILSDPIARAPAFGLNSILNIPHHQVAVKTGTSNDFRDNWTIGYTSDLLVATWVGNNDNRPMSKVASGITGASPIWHNLMAQLLADRLAHTFPVPGEIVSVPICLDTGTLSCAGCQRTKVEVFTKGTEPTKKCSDSPTTATADSLPGNSFTEKTRKLSTRTNLN